MDFRFCVVFDMVENLGQRIPAFSLRQMRNFKSGHLADGQNP